MNDRIKVGDEVRVYVDKNMIFDGTVMHMPLSAMDDWIIKCIDGALYYVRKYKYIEKIRPDSIDSILPCPFCGSEPNFPDPNGVYGTCYERERNALYNQVNDLERLILRVADWDALGEGDKEALFALHRKHFPDNYT